MNRKKFFDILPKKTPADFFEKKPDFKKTKKEFSTGKKFLVFLPFFLISLFLIFYFTLAKVEIEIWPKTEILDFEEKIVANSKSFLANFSEKIIPATILEVEEVASQKFPASGKIEKKAQGKIRVFNKYHLPVNLRLGSRFQPALTSNEILYFCSTQKISIPAKGYIDILVEACQPGEGEKYNIGPSKFSVPGLSGMELYFYVYGESFEPMKGGGKVFQVTKEDLEKAKNILTQTLFEKIENELKDKLSSDYILLEEAIKKEILEISPQTIVGMEAPTFNFQIKAKAQAFTFKKSDLEKFAKDFILTKISEDKKLQEESLKIEHQLEKIDIESGEVNLNLKFSAKVYSDIDFFNLRENLKGKSIDKSKLFLEDRAEITKAQISSWPFWVKNIPKDAKKIDLKITVD